MATVEPTANEFRNGQVWRSPRGTFYRVEETQASSSGDDTARQAVLRQGLEGRGRRIFRNCAQTQGWAFVAPMVTPELIHGAVNGEV